MAKNEERLIRKVIENKTNHQKMVTIPKNCSVSGGDYVELIKVPVISKSKRK